MGASSFSMMASCSMSSSSSTTAFLSLAVPSPRVDSQRPSRPRRSCSISALARTMSTRNSSG